MNLKYPKTLSWPWSPGKGRKSAIHPEPLCFVGVPVVVTEKLDGGNTLLHGGKVYARSVSAPSEAKWFAMVKKHHAWKVTDPSIYLYGEDIYGVHTIAYDAVSEDKTFYAFSIRDGCGAFMPFSKVEAYAKMRNIPIVPVLFRGTFNSLSELREFIDGAHRENSALGGEREGVVIRLARGFPDSEFQYNVCKSVRAGHVRQNEHWRRNWQPCLISPSIQNTTPHATCPAYSDDCNR